QGAQSRRTGWRVRCAATRGSPHALETRREESICVVTLGKAAQIAILREDGCESGRKLGDGDKAKLRVFGQEGAHHRLVLLGQERASTVDEGSAGPQAARRLGEDGTLHVGELGDVSGNDAPARVWVAAQSA